MGGAPEDVVHHVAERLMPWWVGGYLARGRVCGELGRHDDLGDPGQRARHRAHPLGLLRMRLELALIDSRDASLRIQGDARQRGDAVDVSELDARVGAQRLRGVACGAEDVRRAIVKQLAWAAAISCSGFVPFPSPNRES